MFVYSKQNEKSYLIELEIKQLSNSFVLEQIDDNGYLNKQKGVFIKIAYNGSSSTTF